MSGFCVSYFAAQWGYSSNKTAVFFSLRLWFTGKYWCCTNEEEHFRIKIIHAVHAGINTVANLYYIFSIFIWQVFINIKINYSFLFSLRIFWSFPRYYILHWFLMAVWYSFLWKFHLFKAINILGHLGCL